MPEYSFLDAEYTRKRRVFGKQIPRRRLLDCDAGVFLALGFLFGDAGWLTGTAGSCQ
jgi:hypothetical protein